MLKAQKRILSVTIRRMIDSSPDTSHMGEYAQRSTSQFSIDRAHAEDCESLNPGIDLTEDWASWNGSASEALERVRTHLEEYQAEEEHRSSPNGCAEGCEACEEEQPYTDAAEVIYELEKNAGECDCGERGDMGRGEFRYFNPSFNYVTKTDDPADGLTPEEVRKYVREDYARMESANRGDWCYIGIRAEAEVIANVQSEPGGKWHGVVQRVTSGGLWGIESDSERSYIEEEQANQLAELKTELLALGFSKRAISIAFKNVEEKDE